MMFAGVKVQKSSLFLFSNANKLPWNEKWTPECWRFLDILPNTMLKPRHVWFPLSSPEIRMNNLAAYQDMVFATCSPIGLVSCLIAERNHLKVLAQLPGTSHEWWVLHFCFSIVLPYSHVYLTRIPYSHVYTNMLPEHRDAIHLGLWAQYMYFNGLEEAPNLTTGRPLWAVGCWEISVKSHQGFISFWPCHNFFVVLRGTRGTVGKQEDCVHLSLLPEAQTSFQTRPQDSHHKKEIQLDGGTKF